MAHIAWWEGAKDDRPCTERKLTCQLAFAVPSAALAKLKAGPGGIYGPAVPSESRLPRMPWTSAVMAVSQGARGGETAGVKSERG